MTKRVRRVSGGLIEIKNNFMKIFQIFVTIMGIVMSLGYYPQAYKIWKNKSAKDISIPAFIIFSSGTLTWFVYGIVIKDFPIIVGFVAGVVGSWSILFLSIKYRKQESLK